MTDVFPAEFHFRVASGGERLAGLHIPDIAINEARQRRRILQNKVSQPLQAAGSRQSPARERAGTGPGSG